MFGGRKTAFDSLADDAIKLNKACHDSLEICIEQLDGKISAEKAVEKIRNILTDVAFTLEVGEDKE